MFIYSPLETCLDRIKARDQSQHIAVNQDLIAKLHAMSSSLDLKFDEKIDNSNMKSDEEFIQIIKHVLGESK